MSVSFEQNGKHPPLEDPGGGGCFKPQGELLPIKGEPRLWRRRRSVIKAKCYNTIYFPYPWSIFLYKTQIHKLKFSAKSCFPNQPKCPKVIWTFLYNIVTQKSSSYHRLLIKKHTIHHYMD